MKDESPPNKSLDASGISGHFIDNLSVAQLSPAASTQTFGSYVIGELNMKYKLALLIAFFLLGATVGYAQSGGESDSIPFHFSSRGTAFGVQGEFEGTYLIHDGSIEVSVTKATIYVSENCPYQGPRSVNQLRFGLATETRFDGTWKIESAGKSVALNLVMNPKEEYALYNLDFFIPKEGSIDLSKRWFVVEIQTDPLDVPLGKNKKGYVYAFSRKDMFLPPDSNKSKQ